MRSNHDLKHKMIKENNRTSNTYVIALHDEWKIEWCKGMDLNLTLGQILEWL